MVGQLNFIALVGTVNTYLQSHGILIASDLSAATLNILDINSVS